jgi:hypothetical protein
LGGDNSTQLVSELGTGNIEVVQPLPQGFEDIKLGKTSRLDCHRTVCKLEKIGTHNSKHISGIEEIAIQVSKPELNFHLLKTTLTGKQFPEQKLCVDRIGS